MCYTIRRKAFIFPLVPDKKIDFYALLQKKLLYSISTYEITAVCGFQNSMASAKPLAQGYSAITKSIILFNNEIASPFPNKDFSRLLSILFLFVTEINLDLTGGKMDCWRNF
ncbi:hypothetical protein CEXT_480781 [Caerostris extrusa]|uniref:Uncharacterized protein n=1 Tax=Caerostris extrusa TaxID=172846 RepID=A0AAV4WXY6_CAEEX|nr:hypothetical protein CEXT_480781 [Caerostris extrusa]